MNKPPFQQLPKGRYMAMQATLFATNLNDIYTSFLEDGKIVYVAGRCGEFFGFPQLYDWAVDVEKIDLGIGDEAKKELWKCSVKSANKWSERYSVQANKETLKKIATRNYKSELIYKYLVDKFNNTGIKMQIEFDNGHVAKTWEEIRYGK